MYDKRSLPFKNHNWRYKCKESKAQPIRQKTLKQICAAEALSNNPYNYQSIEAPPSTKPIIKYCDITGYPSKYVDSSSYLIFYDRAVSSYIKMLSKPTIENFLSIRKPNIQEKAI